MECLLMQQNDDLNIFYAKIFRRSFFSSLAKGKSLDEAFTGLKNSLLETSNMTLRDVFSSYFDMLKKNYRNEYVYKSAIVNKIIFGRHSPRTCSTSIELPINNSIVDVAVFNGCSTAYEIKSEFDSPKRLSTQTTDYLNVFEKIYIVTHPDLAEKYCNLNIPNVGVISLTTKETLRIEKEAISNFENIKQHSLFNVLRKNEFINIIEDYTKSKITMPNGLIYDYCGDIFNSMPLEVANRYFLKAMKDKSNNKEFIDYIYSLPACLRALGYATPLSKKQKDYIINLMDSKIESS